MLCTDVCFMPLHNRVGVIWPTYTLPYASFYLQIQICLEWWLCGERLSAINVIFNVSWVFPSVIINRSNASPVEMDEPPLTVWFMIVHDLLQDSSWSSPGFIYSSFRWNLQYVDQMDAILQSHCCTFYTYRLFWTDLTIRVMPHSELNWEYFLNSSSDADF